MATAAAQEHPVTHESDMNAEGDGSEDMGSSEHQSHEAAAGASTGQPSGQHARAAAGHAQSCIHCVGGPSAPARSGFDVTERQTRRDAEVAAPRAIKESILPAVASFPALRPTQCSPPAPSQRRHLLIQIFLI